MKALKILMFHFILLSVYLCCLPTSSHASDYSCGANATWHFEEGTLTISGTGEVSGQPWSELQDQIQQVIVEPGITNLPDHAFSHYGSLKNVTLPGSLAEIGSYAFAYCRNLTYIHLPEGLLAIGDWAFYSTGLTGITIPDGVTRIEALTFSACERLSRVTLSPHTTFISNSAFHDCTKLSDIQLPDTLESLGHSAFSHCLSLTEIVLPDSLTVIPFDTFRYCENLSSVNLSPYTTYIGEGAFHDCHKLTSITLPPTVEYIAGFGSDLQQIHISDIAAWCETDFLSGEHNGLANAELYLNGELVTDLVVPEGCEGVWQFAFAGYQHLRSVTLPEGVAGIGWYAFPAAQI